MKQVKNLIVIGCGLHFRERHYRVLEAAAKDRHVRISLVIDLESQRDKILGFFTGKAVVPESFLFFPEELRNGIPFEFLDRSIRSAIDLTTIDGVMISTEPKVHKIYALWAIQNGLSAFIDKPLTAFSSYEERGSLYSDYLEIVNCWNLNRPNVVIACPRRAHIGYSFVKNYLSQIIRETTLPITFFDLHFGGGKFSMPDEFFTRENHPHKYGYGVLLHSGYHYIDLFMNFMSLNESLFPGFQEQVELFVLPTQPHHYLPVYNNQFYANALNTNRFADYFTPEKLSQMDRFGETDIMIMGRFRRGQDIITNFSIKLLDNTVSSRSWHQLPENTYRSNGRMRQESLICHVGPLCSVHVSNSPTPTVNSKQEKMENFTIDIMNNADLLGRGAHMHLKREDLSRLYANLPETEWMNIKAGAWQLLQFLEGKDGNSPLLSHRNTVRFLDLIYTKIA